MARAPLLQITGLSLGYGGPPLFDGLDLVVQAGDRLALVGRNGSGKSTLMKVMAGLVEPDAGARVLPEGTGVGYLEQDPDFAGFATLGDFATASLGASETWRVEAAAEGLDLSLDMAPDRASGGERRRAALARLLAEAPDLMLLDEPTNHLDIAAIGWLEAELSRTRAAFITISHDRAFLRRLARATLWLDRGVVRRMDRPFDDFEDWRDGIWAEEDLARHKLDRKIREEARWAVEGISARRKRNQGRVRELQKLRETRAAMIAREGGAALSLDAGAKGGKRVIEARGISRVFGGRTIIAPLDLRVLRGDRVAIVGPNGAGKTTLLNMLTGAEAPDTGAVTLGTGLELAVFDQTRAALDPRPDAVGGPDPRPGDRRQRALRPGDGARHPAPRGGLPQGFPLRRGAGARAGPVAFGRREGAASPGPDHGAAVEPAGAGRADERPRCRDARPPAGDALGL
jgi:ATP-binding cassette subfamily F protein uup